MAGLTRGDTGEDALTVLGVGDDPGLGWARGPLPKGGRVVGIVS